MRFLGNKEELTAEIKDFLSKRELVDKNLTLNTAYTIGRTFGHLVGTEAKSKSIVVGYDGRLTSRLK